MQGRRTSCLATATKDPSKEAILAGMRLVGERVACEIGEGEIE